MEPSRKNHHQRHQHHQQKHHTHHQHQTDTKHINTTTTASTTTTSMNMDSDLIPAAPAADSTTATNITTTTAGAPQLLPQSPIQQGKQQQQQQQDIGTSAKKKKDRENRNSISQDLSYEWSQKGWTVTVSLVVGAGQDNRTVDIHTDDSALAVYLSDGRRFSTQLYRSVVPEATSVTYRGQKCIIKLQKKDGTVHWQQLEPSKKLPPPQDCIMPPNLNTTTTTTSPLKTQSLEKKQKQLQGTSPPPPPPPPPPLPQPQPTTTVFPAPQLPHHHHNNTNTTTTTTTKNENNTKLVEVESNGDEGSGCSGGNGDGGGGDKVIVVPVSGVKSDYVERDAECLLVVYLYVKGIKRESANVHFTEDSITAQFSTSDPRFLQQYPGSTESTVFEWHLKLKEKVVLEECKYKVLPNNIEMKLKKQINKKWGSLSAISSPDSLLGSRVARNTWVAAGRSEVVPPLAAAAPPGMSLASSHPPALESKKPMCLVSPVSKGNRSITSGLPASSSSFSSSSSSSSSSSYSSSSVCAGRDGGMGTAFPRGTTGLDNIGNTCFMNSVLQCLMNTRELREYFLEYNYQDEINKDNPLGMGGRLATAFASLMKLLWSGSLPSHAPTKLKTTMSLKANQFSGFAQHDAQEFMVELLDGLHEDLNRVKKKPYVAEPPDLDGWPDDRAAQESWKLHRMRNDSIIDDLFKGQFKSTLRCHECGKVSVKFDEFCCLSVPIPKDQKVIPVVFFWKDPYQRPKKYFIRVPATATAEDLRQELSERTCVQASCIQVFERLKSKIHKVYERTTGLSSGNPNDPLMAFEVYCAHKVGEAVVEVSVVQRMMVPSPPTRCAYCSSSAPSGSKLRRCTKCFRAGYCDHTCQKNHWHTHKVNCKLVPELVGCPFILSLPRSHATYSRLARVMEAYARYSVDIFQPPVYHHGSSASSHCSSNSSIDLSPGEENDQMEVDENESQESRTAARGGVDDNSTTSMSWAGDEGRETGMGSDEGSASCRDSTSNVNWDGSADGSVGAGSGDCGRNSDGSSSSGIGSCDRETGENCSDVRGGSSSRSGRSGRDGGDVGGSGRSLRERDRGRDRDSDRERERESDEPPQLSPSVCAVQPQRTIQLPSATQLFVIRPVNSRGQNLTPPNSEALQDMGDEPLDLSDKRHLAMDWKTSESLAGHCLVQDKDVDCEVEGSFSIQRNQPTTLEACIELFTQPENLSEGDSWRCPRCKKPVEATKQMSIWRLPHILIIQLKRFSFKYVLYSDKIDKFVQYRVRGLNLEPYMSGTRPSDGSTLYDLYGVINHMGRLLGGHYTSYARMCSNLDTRHSELDWRLFDDSRVNFCQESRVVNDQAYLLLYRRRDTPFSLHRPLPTPPQAQPPIPTPNPTAMCQEENGMMEQGDTEEATPMSISSASQISTTSSSSSSSQPFSSSLEGEEQLGTTQEELD